MTGNSPATAAATPRSSARSRVWLGLLGVGGAAGLLSLAAPLSTLGEPFVWQKDLVQEFILARALVDGSNPYAAPLQTPYQLYPYPVAHPPITGVLFLPFLPLGYPSAAAAWFLLEIVCLAASVYLFVRALGFRLSPLQMVAVSACALAWYPANSDLYWGQLALVQLPLLVGAWWSLRAGRYGLGGTLVGLCILIKPFLWPLAAFFLLRRMWKALASAVLAVIAGYGLAVLRVGLDTHIDYFTRVLPTINQVYRAYAENISLWSLGWRIFDGTGSTMIPSAIALPLVKSPMAAVVVSAAIPLAALVLGFGVIWRMKDAGLAFGLAICISILISPVSWGHYLVLTSITVVEIAVHLRRARFPRKSTVAAMTVAVTLLMSNQVWKTLAMLFFGVPPAGSNVVPFPIALAAGGPMVAALGLALLAIAVGLTDARVPSQEALAVQDLPPC